MLLMSTFQKCFGKFVLSICDGLRVYVLTPKIKYIKLQKNKESNEPRMLEVTALGRSLFQVLLTY